MIARTSRVLVYFLYKRGATNSHQQATADGKVAHGIERTIVSGSPKVIAKKLICTVNDHNPPYPQPASSPARTGRRSSFL